MFKLKLKIKIKNTEMELNIEKKKKTKNKKVNDLKKKVKAVRMVAVASVYSQLGEEQTIQLAVGVGLYQGLKYNGDFKRGIKAGATTAGVMCVANAVKNVTKNWDEIMEESKNL